MGSRKDLSTGFSNAVSMPHKGRLWDGGHGVTGWNSAYAVVMTPSLICIIKIDIEFAILLTLNVIRRLLSLTALG